MSDAVLAGRRVLVVEDDPTIALLLQDLIEDAGGEVIGPFGAMADARKAVQKNILDLALLDVSLEDGKVYPVADMLSHRAVPFIILSGYGVDSGPNDRPDWLWHSKPFVAEELLAKMKGLCVPTATRKYLGLGAPSFREVQ